MEKIALLTLICGFLIGCQTAVIPATAQVILAAGASATIPAIPNQPASTTTANQELSIPPGCTVISPQPTPGPTEESIFPTVSDRDLVKGPPAAPITIIEYGDFQCPYCARLAPVLAQILKDYPTQIRLVYRYYPLISIHNKAALSTQAAEAAGRQGKFWEMHDLLFNNQKQWVDLDETSFKLWLTDKTTQLGLDSEKFNRDLESQEITGIARRAWEENRSLGIPYTPFILINEQIWADNLPLEYAPITSVIELDLLEKRQFSACPPILIDLSKQYTATIHTEKGDIGLELYAQKAPLTVNNFIFLVQNGWYNDITFHRVIPGYIAQTGDPSATGYGTPGYAFINEISSDLSFNQAGMVGMANAGPDTNGSQFFITMKPAPQLNGNYTIFGKVVSGMEVVENLTTRDPAQSSRLLPGDRIYSIVINQE